MNNKFFNVMQKLGKTFMLPIALLPVAGLLLGIGATITGETFIAQYGLEGVLGEGTVLNGILGILTDVGNIIFSNLALLFAVSVAMGLAKAEKEVAALSAVVGYITMYASITSTIKYFGDIESLSKINGLVSSVLGFDKTLNTGVFGGIVIGLVVVWLHNRFYRVKFVDFLSFFAGTHFIPIISTIAGLILGIIMAFVWPIIGGGIAAMGELIAKSGAIGSFFYGYVYRALIPFGLHHVFYLPFWQTALGGSANVAGEMIHGAQNIVFAQLRAGEVISPEAAKYFSFAFPMMLCGFPMAALAMYHTAKENRKAEVKGLLLSSSITSFFTGITEPIEFSILFASPFLYFGVNAVLAGISVILVQILKIGVGFTFSAGFLDLLLYGILPGNGRTNWIILVVYCLIWGALYYFVFRWAIIKFDLKTPGREDDEEEVKLHTKDEYRESIGMEKVSLASEDNTATSKEDQLSAQILAGLGGKENIVDLTNCATRLRVTVKEGAKVNQAALRKTGAAGVVVSGGSVQVIYGTKVGGIRTDLEDYMSRL
ncbi:PTS transporter subunit EIIC [Tuanshanicoccus lijuaniae]|uniref:PTS transporter subunit EIIC n=1 Tax=Aerococcaceae bacterium zg-1292 TaxID=2774330 RepID=UPI001BD8BF32|nr:PTS transporter subunit EIIC [Aerococcaceae bacterium zg-A91]MBS4458342.1 PTS transporter subunit EIIC [Aerococcaceae bacterium zg-BR33]